MLRVRLLHQLASRVEQPTIHLVKPGLQLKDIAPQGGRIRHATTITMSATSHRVLLQDGINRLFCLLMLTSHRCDLDSTVVLAPFWLLDECRAVCCEGVRRSVAREHGFSFHENVSHAARDQLPKRD